MIYKILSVKGENIDIKRNFPLYTYGHNIKGSLATIKISRRKVTIRYDKRVGLDEKELLNKALLGSAIQFNTSQTVPFPLWSYTCYITW